MEDRFLLAVVGLLGSLMGAIATVTVGWVSARAKQKQADFDQWQAMLDGGLKAHQMAQEIMRQVHEDLDEEVSDLRKTVQELEAKTDRLLNSQRAFSRIVADVVDTDELEEIDSRLAEESDVEDLTVDWW